MSAPRLPLAVQTKRGSRSDSPSDRAKDGRKRAGTMKQPVFYFILSAALAVLAGASVVLQQVLNANLRGAVNSAAWSGFVSYLVGLICMAVFAFAVRDPIPSASVAAGIPWWAGRGGLFGSI